MPYRPSSVDGSSGGGLGALARGQQPQHVGAGLQLAQHAEELGRIGRADAALHEDALARFRSGPDLSTLEMSSQPRGLAPTRWSAASCAWVSSSLSGRTFR